MKTKTFFCSLALLAGIATATVSKGQLQVRVNVDTHSLIGNPAGPYSLDFQLNDGSGWGDANNTASLSGFKFGSGGAAGSGSSFGGAGGDLGSNVWLTDSSPFNEFYQGFTPGSWLSFDLSLTTNVDGGGTPDAFSFAILDGALMNLPTQSPGSDAFLAINIDSATPWVSTYSSVDGLITVTATPVPEAASYGFCAAGLLAMAGLARRFHGRRNLPA
ncbi:MAG TPA: NF038129 family PEP-CTERM protein [Opitutaceae bacterium]